MMSESVTVTVQNGSEPNRGTTGQPVQFSLNLEYFRSIPGICKIAQVILGILCLIFGASAIGWFTFVALTAFILSVLWSAIYAFSVREAVKLPINWLLSELCYTGLYTILYFTAFIIGLAFAGHSVSAILAGIFGIFNTIAYAAGTYFLYLEYQGNQR